MLLFQKFFMDGICSVLRVLFISLYSYIKSYKKVENVMFVFCFFFEKWKEEEWRDF